MTVFAPNASADRKTIPALSGVFGRSRRITQSLVMDSPMASSEKRPRGLAKTNLGRGAHPLPQADVRPYHVRHPPASTMPGLPRRHRVLAVDAARRLGGHRLARHARFRSRRALASGRRGAPAGRGAIAYLTAPDDLDAGRERHSRAPNAGLAQRRDGLLAITNRTLVALCRRPTSEILDLPRRDVLDGRHVRLVPCDWPGP